MSKNLISIIVPTFNRCHLIGDTLQSVLEQSFKNWECIIIDDGSTDYTEELLEFYIKLDERIKFFKRPDYLPKGANSCRNYGFDKSCGSYIQYLDDDDLISEKKFEIQMNVFSKDNNCSIAMSTWKFVKNNVPEDIIQNEFKGLQSIDIIQYYQIITKRFTFVPSNAFIIPTKLIHDSGGWNVDLQINQDAEFFNRVFLKASKIQCISHEECFAFYRFHHDKRITKNQSYNLRNLLFGYELMSANLKNSQINCEFYFRWKLGELLCHKKNNLKVFKDYEDFLKEYSISLYWYNYKNLKFSIYSILYPYYRKYLKVFFAKTFC